MLSLYKWIILCCTLSSLEVHCLMFSLKPLTSTSTKNSVVRLTMQKQNTKADVVTLKNSIQIGTFVASVVLSSFSLFPVDSNAASIIILFSHVTSTSHTASTATLTQPALHTASTATLTHAPSYSSVIDGRRAQPDAIEKRRVMEQVISF